MTETMGAISTNTGSRESMASFLITAKDEDKEELALSCIRSTSKEHPYRASSEKVEAKARTEVPG